MSKSYLLLNSVPGKPTVFEVICDYLPKTFFEGPYHLQPLKV